VAAITLAVFVSACGGPAVEPDAASGSHPMDMKMTLMPMPAIYAGQADKEGAPMFKGLGAHTHKISTTNAQTQAYFNQGVNLVFGFNHAEAIRSFREAARLDRECAMCWWGIAFSLGSNINLPMQPDAVAPAWDALAKAQALKAHASSAEREWIDALAVRYTNDAKADRKLLDAAFAEAMGKIWKAHPDDLDAGVFYAEALMDTQPWDYWEANGKTPKGNGAEIVATLEAIIKKAPEHPGALHLYIHAVEASTTPERAEAAADKLLSLMPEAGHIVHMPSHIYYRVGRYADSVRANEQAAMIDEAYVAACKAQGFYPVGYYGHNIHFLWTSSEMEGRYQAAIDAARRLVKTIDVNGLATAMPLAELYGFTPVTTLLRFGKWDEVLAEPPPPPALKLDTAMWLYARGFAQIAKRDLKGAAATRDTLEALSKEDLAAYDAAMLPARQMMSMALNLLNGEMLRASGDLTRAIIDFQAAQTIEKGLPYMEPPYWHQPVAHILGAALLEAKRPGEAERVYRESLAIYRRDGWALFGLAQALEAQGKTTAAQDARKQYAAVWTLADVKLTSSRF